MATAQNSTLAQLLLLLLLLQGLPCKAGPRASVAANTSSSSGSLNSSTSDCGRIGALALQIYGPVPSATSCCFGLAVACCCSRAGWLLLLLFSVQLATLMRSSFFRRPLGARSQQLLLWWRQRLQLQPPLMWAAVILCH